MGGLGRRSVSLTKGAVVGEFRVEEPVSDTFFLFGIYGLILVKTGGGNGVVDGGLQQISSISFLRDPIVS